MGPGAPSPPGLAFDRGVVGWRLRTERSLRPARLLMSENRSPRLKVGLGDRARRLTNAFISQPGCTQPCSYFSGDGAEFENCHIRNIVLLVILVTRMTLTILMKPTLLMIPMIPTPVPTPTAIGRLLVSQTPRRDCWLCVSGARARRPTPPRVCRRDCIVDRSAFRARPFRTCFDM